MRAKVNPELRAGVDGVLPGAEGDFADTRATRALIDGGILLPLEELPPEPPARVKRPPMVGAPDASSDLEALRRANAEGAARVSELNALAAKLEAENTELRAALDNSSRSYESQLTELRTALEAARAKPKKGAPAPDAPAEG
jgi:hypothetical protein